MWDTQNNFVTDPDRCPFISLQNGNVNYSSQAVNEKFDLGTVATYSCNDGYSPSGSNSRKCASAGRDARWFGKSFHCQKGNCL